MRRIVFTTLVLSAFLLLAENGHTEDKKEEARRHLRAGNALLNLSDFDGAVREFEITVELHPSMKTIFNLAAAYRSARRYPESLAAFYRLMGEFGDRLDDETLKNVTRISEELEKIVTRIRIEVNMPNAEIYLNDEQKGTSPLERPIVVSPGTYQLRVIHPTAESYEITIECSAGEVVTRRINLVAKAHQLVYLGYSAPKKAKVLPNAVALVPIYTGASLILVSLLSNSIYQASLDRNNRTDADKEQTETIGNVHLAVALSGLGVAIAGGVLFWFTELGHTVRLGMRTGNEERRAKPKERSTVSFSPIVSPTGVGLRGAF